MCYCHDKRLRNFLSLVRLFSTIFGVVLFFVFLFKMAVFSLFLRNVLLPIEILKIKILEHSDPPSQHFFVHKAFSHSLFFMSPEGCAVSSGRMAHRKLSCNTLTHIIIIAY